VEFGYKRRDGADCRVPGLAFHVYLATDHCGTEVHLEMKRLTEWILFIVAGVAACFIYDRASLIIQTFSGRFGMFVLILVLRGFITAFWEDQFQKNNG
jgi:hypothetical protein